MTAGTWVAAVFVVLLVVMGFLVAGAETALTAASRARLVALERSGNRRARLVGTLLSKREAVGGALILGRALAEIAAASLATFLVWSLLGTTWLALALTLLVLVAILFIELAARLIAANHAERFALAEAIPIRLAIRLLSPVAAVLIRLASAALGVLGLRTSRRIALAVAGEEPRGAADPRREGAGDKVERDTLLGPIDLKDLTVGDVMVHRTKMVSIDLGQGAGPIVQAALAAPYTRIPVWRDTPDNIVGVIHAKDLLRALDAVGNDLARLDLEEIARPAWFVPDTTSLLDQLKSFRRKKRRLACVVDEYGVVLGIITLEDIIEEIAGDFSGEHDVVVTGVRPQADGSVNVDGSVPIRDLNRAMDWDLPDEAATTIAGLVIHEAQTIPEAGQTFTFHGFRFQVLRKQRNRLTALRITPLEPMGVKAAS
jgi:Mg2+/Co2+ transporter CorB